MFWASTGQFRCRFNDQPLVDVNVAESKSDAFGGSKLKASRELLDGQVLRFQHKLNGLGQRF